MTTTSNPALAAAVANFSGRVMLHVDNGLITGYYRMRENEHTGTVQELIELAREAGWGDAQITGISADDAYSLVRATNGLAVANFPNNGRWQVCTNAGIASVRPLSDEEILITPAGMIQFLQRCGYSVTNLIRD